MSDAPANGNTPQAVPNPWAAIGLPATFNPLVPCGFLFRKVKAASGETRYVLVMQTMQGTFGFGFDEAGFAQFCAQAASLRTGLVLPT